MLAHGGDAGVGVDAAELEELHAGFLHGSHHAVVETDFFDGAAAVGQQYAFAELFQFIAEETEFLVSEVNPHRVLKGEIVHDGRYVDS